MSYIFANVNIIYFISKLLNIEQFKINFILYLIKVLQLSDEVNIVIIIIFLSLN